MLIAIASSALALYLVCQDKLPFGRLLSGGILMGLGIASMHYTGMEAMLMNPYIFYVPWLVVLSIIIAIIASLGALWLAFRLREEAKRATVSRMGAALVMAAPLSECTTREWLLPSSPSTVSVVRLTVVSIQNGWPCWSSL
nr:MHYT domain-containing protein [Marinobacter sp. AC-23]